jgi:hypothetical protein
VARHQRQKIAEMTSGIGVVDEATALAQVCFNLWYALFVGRQNIQNATRVFPAGTF